jgi:pheromone shutdown protein TraB
MLKRRSRQGTMCKYEYHFKPSDHIKRIVKISLIAWILPILTESNAFHRRRRRYLTPSWISQETSIIKIVRGGSSYGIINETTAVTKEQAVDSSYYSKYVTNSSENDGSETGYNNNRSDDISQRAQQQINQTSWRMEMPSLLRQKGAKTFQKLQLGKSCVIYIIGTAHVSNNSSYEVRQLLEHVNPTCIFVELCEERIPLLESVASHNHSNHSQISTTATTITTNNSQIKKSSFRERMKQTQESQGGSLLQSISTVLLTSIQEDFASELSVELGGEFKCAYKYWKTIHHDDNNQVLTTSIPPYLVLGDRPFHLTLIRAWESLWLWPKFKLLIGLIVSSMRKPNKDEMKRWLDSVMEEGSDVLTESFHELRKQFPTLYETIIEERDAWLAAKLVQTCRALSNNHVRYGTNHIHDPVVVVAIVGAGHVPGICRYLSSKSSETPETILSKLVTTRRWSKNDIIQNHSIPRWINDVTQLQ